MNPVNKQYGLLMPKKKQSTFKVSNVFGDDSDEETPKQEINSSLQRSSLQAKIKRQTQLEIDKALEADPTVYEYDSIYDDLQATKEEKDLAVKQKKDRKPKYIAGLLKAAETRKREDERRAERKVQKERENEGGEFDDKEVFVTGAYRKKMQEMQELEEKERREAAMEELLDVKKQKDMSGFYRYMLNQQSGEATAEKKEKEDVSVKEEPDSPKQSSSSGPEEKTRSGSDISQRAYRERGSSKERNSRRSSSRDRGRRSSSRDRGRRSRDSSDDSRERHDRMREKSESKDRHRKRKHSPDSPRHSRKNTSDRDKRRESSREKELRRDKQRHRRGSDSGSEDPDRDSLNKYRPNEKERLNKDKYSRKQGEYVEREKSPERETKTEKRSENKPESKDIKKSGVVSKKTTDSAASEARKRYLERKLAKEKAKLSQQE
ncbi:nuclear speckle splicing regulatory protein 1-like [Saccostrea echinata]|uniref:nuclear speckle splicing regulatory protein 1-like n=1 Tax=Saccostrea echinata TaxID=191078 RepID=UPI002A82D1E9|nr:nuclear speckle splicing regulatory protein 1-like [Saccostrea echinata]